MNPSYSCLIF